MRASVWPAVTTTLVLWASAFIAIRIALPTMGFLGLSVGRLLIASLAVLAVRRFFAVPMPERGDFVRIGLCGLTGMAAYQLLLNAGELTVEAGVASLLVNTGPIFAAILARLLLGEALNGYVKTGIAIGFAGACLVALAGDSGLALSPGALLVLGAALSQALYFVLSKPLSARYGGFAIACYAIWSGTVLSLPLLPWLVLRAPQASPAAIGALVFLGVGPSAVGFVSWAYAQARMDIAAATNLLYLVPFIAGGIGWVVLGERPALLAVIGGLIALFGVAVSRRRPPRQGPVRAGRRRQCCRPIGPPVPYRRRLISGAAGQAGSARWPRPAPGSAAPGSAGHSSCSGVQSSDSRSQISRQAWWTCRRSVSTEPIAIRIANRPSSTVWVR